MEPVVPVVVVDEQGLRAGEFACMVCGKATRQKRKWARFCSQTCRFRQWAKEHPRKPAGSVIVPQGTRIALPDSVDSFQALADLVGLPKPIVAPEPSNAVLEAVSEIGTLKARLEALESRKQFGRGSSGQDPTRWKHGANCYRNHGCRCDVCVEGKRAVGRARRRPR